MRIQRSTDILTVEETAKRLHVHPNTVRKMTKDGEIPAYKFHRRIVYRKDDVDLFINSLEVYQPCGS